MLRRVLLLSLLAVTACSGEEDDDDTTTMRDAGVEETDGGETERDGGEAPRDGGVERDGGPDRDGGAVDGGWTPPQYNRWLKFEPDGAACANGSQYKYFVNFSETSDDVVIYFEGGGACWDYAGCTGTGIRSAANRDGIPDDHATAYADLGGFAIPVDNVFPLLHPSGDVSPMAEWNKVFIPYCTGDVFSGDTVVTYEDPDNKEPDVEFHHVGHANVLATVDQLAEIFPSIERMLVSGCSAGGAGAVINYHFLRDGLSPNRGYLLDDSGPLFPDQEKTSWSLPLHDRVRAAWNVDPLIQSAPMANVLATDLGALADILAQTYPNDRLAHTHFRLDYNYSLYSYERFYTLGKGGIATFGDGMGLGGLGLDETIPEDRAAVYEMWWDDTDLMRAQFDARPNLGYFMPFYRTTNSSHCTTIPGIGEFPEDELFDLFLNDFNTLAWAGTELPATLVGGSTTANIRAYVEHLLDDQMPLQSFFEVDGEGRYLACTPDPMYFDEQMCADAHVE
ncbi:MAG: pectin acetylesterase-family hydrolase [Deltaproteobacteria bacterium]|jgi:hypothetical protein